MMGNFDGLSFAIGIFVGSYGLSMVLMFILWAEDLVGRIKDDPYIREEARKQFDENLRLRVLLINNGVDPDKEGGKHENNQ